MTRDEFLQAPWPMLRVAYLYYCENRQIREISELTALSPSTVTRLLQRARQQEIVKISIPDDLLSCIRTSGQIAEKYQLRFVVVIPLSHYKIWPEELEMRYKNLALEGARYLQHVIRPEDVLGIGCNWMLRDLADFLNPCFKIEARFAALSGMLPFKDDKRDMTTLVTQFAKSFGWNISFLPYGGLADNEAQLAEWLQHASVQKHMEWYRHITVSVANMQCMLPGEGPLSILRQNMRPGELDELYEKNVAGEFLLRFFDWEGKEIDSAVRKRTFSIAYEIYKKIPTKIVLAAGEGVIPALDVFLTQGMADILIVDEYTAEGLLRQ